AVAGNGALRLGIRAEAIEPTRDGGALRGSVILAELAGPDLFLTVRLGDGAEIVARADPRAFTAREGEAVSLALDPARIHLFDAETGIARHHGAA
ncbi:MAG: TOBE domain-containing protein, partial [Alphaproteobacteria bacterium]|nr:TOBE domain-containing protein [Alphaproteobacteria bacterium]